MVSPSWCTLCKNNSESNDHMLLNCKFAKYIWAKLLKEFEVIGALPKSWYEFLCVDWCFRGRRKKAKFL